MHPNPVFRGEDRARSLQFARERGFGVLAINAPDGPLMSHVPVLISEDGGQVDLHLVRSNPILRQISDPRPARIAVTGPDAYISPDWYGVDDQVPTWNYVAVHLTGSLERRPQDEMPDLLAAQSAHFEQYLRPKPPWTMDKMAPDVRDRMMRMIVPCRMYVDAIDATWKLNQNKTPDARRGAMQQVAAAGIGSEVEALAALMAGVADTEA